MHLYLQPHTSGCVSSCTFWLHIFLHKYISPQKVHGFFRLSTPSLSTGAGGGGGCPELLPLPALGASERDTPSAGSGGGGGGCSTTVQGACEGDGTTVPTGTGCAEPIIPTGLGCAELFFLPIASGCCVRGWADTEGAEDGIHARLSATVTVSTR